MPAQFLLLRVLEQSKEFALVWLEPLRMLERDLLYRVRCAHPYDIVREPKAADQFLKALGLSKNIGNNSIGAAD